MPKLHLLVIFSDILFHSVFCIQDTSSGKFKILLETLPDTPVFSDLVTCSFNILNLKHHNSMRDCFTKVTNVAKKCLAENRLQWPLDNVGSIKQNGYGRYVNVHNKRFVFIIKQFYLQNFLMSCFAGAIELLLPCQILSVKNWNQHAILASRMVYFHTFKH